MMFHFYFTGNPEGLLFDVCNTPFSHALWNPFRSYLESLGVELRLETPVRSVRRGSGTRWEVTTDDAALGADAVVLAVPVPALQSIVSASPGWPDERWRRDVEELELTYPFAVWRLWLDRPTAAERAPFVGTTGVGLLDNISLYHECREAGMVEERFLLTRDCPAFAPGSHATRPGVETPFPGVSLAGDHVKLPFPSALMERAAASGFLAANSYLKELGETPEPIESITGRGMLAGLPI